jgi:hypothetical protein
MAAPLTAAEIEKAVRALVTAEKTNLGIEVSVPVAYGDGELTTVVVEDREEKYLVHDAGFSAMRLSSAGIPLTRHIVHRLNEYTQRYRCEFRDGRVTSASDFDSLSQVVCLVANASRSVADYTYEIRRQAEYDFRVVVFERLREIVGNRARQYEEFRGKSGRRWRLPILLDPTESRPEHFISAVPHRQVVPQSFAMLYDLAGAFPDVERDAVYDEASDIRDEDRSLLSSVEGTNVMGLMEAPLRFRGLIRHG